MPNSPKGPRGALRRLNISSHLKGEFEDHMLKIRTWWLPWLRLKRATSMPASSSWLSPSSLQHLGPMVHTILVERVFVVDDRMRFTEILDARSDSVGVACARLSLSFIVMRRMVGRRPGLGAASGSVRMLIIGCESADVAL